MNNVTLEMPGTVSLGRYDSCPSNTLSNLGDIMSYLCNLDFSVNPKPEHLIMNFLL